MGTEDVLERLKQLSNPERLIVIEEANRLIIEELASRPPEAGADDPLLQVAGCLSGEPLSAAEIEQELYGNGRP